MESSVSRSSLAHNATSKSQDVNRLDDAHNRSCLLFALVSHPPLLSPSVASTGSARLRCKSSRIAIGGRNARGFVPYRSLVGHIVQFSVRYTPRRFASRYGPEKKKGKTGGKIAGVYYLIAAQLVLAQNSCVRTDTPGIRALLKVIPRVIGRTKIPDELNLAQRFTSAELR